MEWSKKFFLRLFPHILAVGTIILTIVGWLVLVIGYGIGTVQDNQATSGATRSYAFWASIMSGVVAIIFLIIHILVPQPVRSIVGSLTTLFGVYFAANLGIVLWRTGSIINDELLIPEIITGAGDSANNLEFAGSLIAIIFLAATMVIGNFYDINLGLFGHMHGDSD